MNLEPVEEEEEEEEEEERMQQSLPDFFLYCDGAYNQTPTRHHVELYYIVQRKAWFDGIAKCFTASSSLASEIEAVRRAWLLINARNLENATVICDFLNVIKLSTSEDVFLQIGPKSPNQKVKGSAKFFVPWTEPGPGLLAHRPT
ncbi:unnamed protein product [Ilex paraguariensis]|uniref:RNase H type-1 domain-containing protein n=1 Tax=Ilex paraguariensis TaxID=185542 RepID=A0ABC8RFR5_9AQUA